MLLTAASRRVEYSMILSKKSPRIAILGAKGVGLVHARIFNQLGADVCAILGSSKKSSLEAAVILKNSFGIKAQPFYNLNILLKKIKPEAVSICTPPFLHFTQIITAFNHGAAVFCEKPLFWHDEINIYELEQKLSQIENHSERRLFVNTSNAIFIDILTKKLRITKNIHSFSFSFYTQGSNLGKDIASDLLPHAFSLLLRFLPHAKISHFKQEVKQHNYRCNFNYCNCRVKFDFQELINGPKEFIFEINNRKFTRIQKGYGNTYKVYFLDSKTKKKIEVSDPFCVYINNFLEYCRKGFPIKQDQFDEAAFNIRLMGKVLLRKKND